MIFTPKVLEQHIAILGKTGSGKTVTAKGIVEHLLRKKERVCIIDPVSAWWGLRSDATGKGEGFPVVVFGGAHGDIPIGGSHGAAVAETVGGSNTPTIIDLKMMSVKDRTKFFTDFAVSIMQKNQGVLHMVIDEAHLFAPKGRVNSNQAGEMLSETNNLVNGGRGLGFRFILITQRPAKLHNDCLSAIETLVAMRVTLGADRDAIETWIKDCASVQQGKEVLASLPLLPTGEGWVWSPESDILKRTTFPMITTFDSSNPQNLHRTTKVNLSAINLPEIRTRLEQAAGEVVNDDPVQLKRLLANARAEIRQRDQASKAPAIPAAAKAPDPEALKKEFDCGAASVKRALAKDVVRYTTAMEKLLSRYTVAFNAARERLDATANELASLEKPTIPDLEAIIQEVQAGRVAEPPTLSLPMRVARPAAERILRQRTQEMIIGGPAAPARPARAPQPAAQNNGDLSGPEQRILDAIAWMESIGIMQPEQVAVAFLAGYTYGGGAFNNPRGALNTKGYLEYGAGNTIRLTDAGRSHARFPQEAGNAEELQRMVLDRLPRPERKILEVILAAYPNSLSNEECAEKAGYTHGGGGYNNPRGRLRTLGLIEYQSGQVVARPILFLEGGR
jgi:hypothetical protein